LPLYNVFVLFIIKQFYLVEIKYINVLLIDLPSLHYSVTFNIYPTKFATIAPKSVSYWLATN